MKREVRTALIMFVLTLVSMFWAGTRWTDVAPGASLLEASLRGYSFALPLMAILLAHEFGHYFAARIHHVDASLPYFIPMPIGLIGTFGAVISMRGNIKWRNALFDIGASGPLCGLLVALPVLLYGIATSEVQPLPSDLDYYIEGRSLLYLALIYAMKGPIPEGSDLMLTPTALAGWAGLLVTMINLVPVGQLDGGHVAYALFGPKQDTYSRRLRWALLVIASVISLSNTALALRAGARGEALINPAISGMYWLMWWGVLTVMARYTGEQHPPTEPSALSPARRLLAWLTLALFPLLFMPTWISIVTATTPDPS